MDYSQKQFQPQHLSSSQSTQDKHHYAKPYKKGRGSGRPDRGGATFHKSKHSKYPIKDTPDFVSDEKFEEMFQQIQTHYLQDKKEDRVQHDMTQTPKQANQQSRMTPSQYEFHNHRGMDDHQISYQARQNQHRVQQPQMDSMRTQGHYNQGGSYPNHYSHQQSYGHDQGQEGSHHAYSQRQGQSYYKESENQSQQPVYKKQNQSNNYGNNRDRYNDSRAQGNPHHTQQYVGYQIQRGGGRGQGPQRGMQNPINMQQHHSENMLVRGGYAGQGTSYTYVDNEYQQHQTHYNEPNQHGKSHIMVRRSQRGRGIKHGQESVPTRGGFSGQYHQYSTYQHRDMDKSSSHFDDFREDFHFEQSAHFFDGDSVASGDQSQHSKTHSQLKQPRPGQPQPSTPVYNPEYPQHQKQHFNHNFENEDSHRGQSKYLEQKYTPKQHVNKGDSAGQENKNYEQSYKENNFRHFGKYQQLNENQSTSEANNQGGNSQGSRTIFDVTCKQSQKKISLLHSYKPFEDSVLCFSQGPTYEFIREVNHSNSRQKFYQNANYDKVQQFTEDLHQEDKNLQQSLVDVTDVFDFKKEKLKGNQFWNKEQKVLSQVSSNKAQSQKMQRTNSSSKDSTSQKQSNGQVRKSDSQHQNSQQIYQQQHSDQRGGMSYQNKSQQNQPQRYHNESDQSHSKKASKNRSAKNNKNNLQKNNSSKQSSIQSGSNYDQLIENLERKTTSSKKKSLQKISKLDSKDNKSNTQQNNKNIQGSSANNKLYQGKTGQGNQYEDFLKDEKVIEQNLKTGHFFEGTLKVNANNRKRAYVTVDCLDKDILIDGLISQNRALDGDTVVVQLLPTSKWLLNQDQKFEVQKVKSESMVNSTTKGQSVIYTNESAIETRVIDLQDPGSSTQGQFKDQPTFGGATINKNTVIGQEIYQDAEDDAYLDESDSDYETVTDSEEEEEESLHAKASQQIQKQQIYMKYLEKKRKPLSLTKKQSTDYKKKTKSGSQTYQSKAQNDSNNSPVNKPEQSNKVFIDFNNKSREEIISQINKVSENFRAVGKVVAIKDSPNRDKELLVTIKSMDDNSETTLKQAVELKKSMKNTKMNQGNLGIYAIPVSKKLPWMALKSIPDDILEKIDESSRNKQHYYMAKIIAWKPHCLRPVCKITQSIGEAGNLEAESLRLLKTFDICTEQYETEGQKPTDKVHECLKVFMKDIDPVTQEWKIPQSEIDKRLDLRSKRIFTIDPITAKDLDDALSIEKISDTIFEIGVHIADVSYFVTQGSELDKEAQLRCTSTYFVHKVYPMLPRLLCERLCSLNPQVDRLAYSIFFRMNLKNGEQDKSFTPYITRSVIRTCAKWNYQLVQNILDGEITSEDHLSADMKPVGHTFNAMRDDCFKMNEIAQKRRKRRLEGGSIMLYNREFFFQLDQSSQEPMSFTESFRMESKALVEEYMLMANILVAEFLQKYCKDKTLLRTHADVTDDKKVQLQEFYAKAGLGSIDVTNSTSFSETMESLRDTGDTDKFLVALRKFLTCLQPAKYECIDAKEADDYSHYGLGFPLYTHFTSPIRRYADLLVHRLITISLTHKEKTRELIDSIDYSRYGELCTEKSLNAKKASQNCQRLFHCMLLKSQGERAFEALIFDVDNQGIQVYLHEVNMHHKIRFKDDRRVEQTAFFDDEIKLVVFYKNSKKHKISSNSSDELKQNTLPSRVLEDEDDADLSQAQLGEEKAIDENCPSKVEFKVYDRIKVIVTTTTEFPLDIVVQIVVSDKDKSKYNAILRKDQEKQEQLQVNGNTFNSSACRMVSQQQDDNINDEF